MKKKSFLRAICLSFTALVLSGVALAATTWSLFSDNREVNNHIEAGDLSVGLTLRSVSGTQTNAAGIPEYFERNTVVDLGKDSSPVFAFTNAIPGVAQNAVLEIENLGVSAFDCEVRVVTLVAEGTAATALAEQIRITVSAEGLTPVVFWLSEWEKPESVASLGRVLAGGLPLRFSVKAEFAEGENNNAAKSGELTFDLQVRAVQATE